MSELQKAISQIKFPVRYDEVFKDIRDNSGQILIAFSARVKMFELSTMHAFGHALAEMINGLDGRGNLQEGYSEEEVRKAIDMARDTVESRFHGSWYYRHHDADSIIKSISKAPDRQVKSADTAIHKIKEYVRSLNTPDNEVYQSNELLIQSCFAKAMEIIEENFKGNGDLRSTV